MTIFSRFRAGLGEAINGAAACHACNEFKGAYWPRGDDDFTLLHPERDDLSVHFRERDDGFLESQTERGRFHLERLHLNRPELVAQRLQTRRTAQIETERDQLLEELRQISLEMQRLRAARG